MTTKLFRRIFVFVAVIGLFSVATFAQQLVKAETNGRMTSADLNARLTKLFGKYPIAPGNADVELIKLTYTSLDASNKKANLTGLLAVPVGGASKGLVIYCHGTTVDRDRSPSKFKGKGEAPETAEALAAFASGGYAVLLPDYIGMGDHKAAHPYPLNKVNARSGVDIIPAAREAIRQRDLNVGDALFVTGYSEGGGVAMALTQALQAYSGPEYKVTRSAPMSGPYDLSGATREFLIRDTGEQVDFILTLYLSSYAVNYLVNDKKMKWKDFYKPALANALAINYKLNPSDDGLIKNIGVTTALMRSKNLLSNVIQPKFLTALRQNDRRNAFVNMLHENDVYDWQLTTQMLMIALEGDTIVSPKNTENAYRAMRDRGIGTGVMRKLIVRDAELNHLTGIAPLLSKSRKFFDGGFTAVETAN